MLAIREDNSAKVHDHEGQAEEGLDGHLLLHNPPDHADNGALGSDAVIDS